MSTNRLTMKCSCCGGWAGRWEQYPNQDEGWGVCYECVQWLKAKRNYTDRDIVSYYGNEGVNWGKEQQQCA